MGATALLPAFWFGGHFVKCLAVVRPTATRMELRHFGLNGQGAWAPGSCFYSFEWDDVHSVHLQDASRLTATRMLAFGLIGAGMKKTQTLVVIATSTETLQFMSMNAAVQIRAGMTPYFEAVPAMQRLANGLDGVVPAQREEEGLAEGLEKLATLHSSGALTAEEFASAKQALLRR